MYHVKEALKIVGMVVLVFAALLLAQYNDDQAERNAASIARRA